MPVALHYCLNHERILKAITILHWNPVGSHIGLLNYSRFGRNCKEAS